MPISSKLHTFLGAAFVLVLLLLFSAACGAVTPTPRITRTPTLPRLSPTTSPTASATHDPAYPLLNKLATLGKGNLSSVLRSADGKIIATSENKVLTILNASDGSQIASIPFSGYFFSGIEAISPNNRFVVVSGCCVSSMTVFDIETQKELNGSSSAFGFVGSPVFMPDSQSLVYLNGGSSTGGPYHSICLLGLSQVTSVTDGTSDCYPILSSDGEEHNTFTPPALSPDGSLVAAAYASRASNVLYIWDAQKKTIRFKLTGQAAEIESVAFSPDGRLLAAAGRDGLVRLWDPATGTLKRTVTGFVDDINKVAFTPNGRGLIVSVIDHPDVVYDLVSDASSPAVSPTLDPLAVTMIKDGYLLGGRNPNLLFSPDGKQIAVADRSIQIWDVQTRQLLQTFVTDPPLSLAGMTYSPDGNHLALIDDAGNLFSWNIVTGQRELTLSVAELEASQPLFPAGSAPFVGSIGAGVGGERSLAFSPDGKTLALGNGLTVDVWDIASASKLRTLEQTQPAANPTAVSFSDDGRFIYAVFNHNRDAAIWDAATGKLLRRHNLPKVDSNAYTAIALQGALFARNNDNYADGSSWIELWDLARGRVTKLQTPYSSIEPLRFSADGRFFAALVGRGQIYIWRVDTGQLVLMTEKTFDVDDLAMNPSGDLLATAHLGQVSLWELGPHLKTAFAANFTPPPLPTAEPPDVFPVDTPQPTQVVKPLALPRLAAGAISVENASRLRVAGHFGNGQISRLVWDQNGIIVTGSDGIHQYAPTTLKETSYFALDGISAGQGRVLNGGGLLAAGAVPDGKIQLWDGQQNKMLLELPGVGEPDISPDGKTLVFARESGGLITWSIETGQPAALLRSYWSDLSWPAFSPDGKHVAAIESDRSIRLWDTATGVILDELGGPPVAISQMAFSPDGTHIVAAADGSAWVWRVQDGSLPVEIVLSKGGDGEPVVSAVAMDKTNTRVAVVSTDHTIWLYDARSAQVLGKLTENNSLPFALTFSPDNTQLLSLDADGRMIVWDLATYKPLLTSQTMQASIRAFVVRKDGRLSAWGQNTIWTLGAGDASLQKTTFIPNGYILSVSPVGDLAAMYSPFQVSLYDALTGKLKQTLPDEAEKVEPSFYWQSEIPRVFHGATFDRAGRQLATFGTGGVWLYNLPSGAKTNHLSAQNVFDAEFSLDNNWLLTALPEEGSFNACPRIFQAKDATPGMMFCPFNGFKQTRISPDKRWVGAVIKSWDEDPSRLLIADTSTGQVSKQLNFEHVAPVSLAFNPDVSLIAVGQENGKIALVDFATMKIVTLLTGHVGPVDSLAFSADGRSLFSLGNDGVLKIWSLP